MFTKKEKDIIISALGLLLSKLKVLRCDITTEELLKIVKKL